MCKIRQKGVYIVSVAPNQIKSNQTADTANKLATWALFSLGSIKMGYNLDGFLERGYDVIGSIVYFPCIFPYHIWLRDGFDIKNNYSSSLSICYFGILYIFPSYSLFASATMASIQLVQSLNKAQPNWDELGYMFEGRTRVSGLNKREVCFIFMVDLSLSQC